MIILRVATWTALLAASLPDHHVLASPLYSGNNHIDAAATLNSQAPSTRDLGSIHLLLENDVDAMTPKFPVILLSKPRSYEDGQAACSSLGENLVAATFGNLTRLLHETPVAQTEVKGITRLWVSNNGTNSTICEAFNRKTGHAVQLSCAIKLPSLCTNSAPPTTALQKDLSKQIKVRTRRIGTWQGYRDRNQFRFLGIPYAEPPVGNLRFMAPRRIHPSKFSANTTDLHEAAIPEKINDATEFGHVCMQLGLEGMNSSQLVGVLGADQSEDCLYLNVFTPSLKSRRVKGLPVMVYVHGGSYTSFSGSVPLFEPGNMVSRAGVVVVTLNYRMSIFGLFENAPAISRRKAPGNLAVRDQIAALWWVRKNIASFGGNPSQVTIFGESAGAYSMRALLSAPSAFGLYRNVISMSDLMGVPFSSSAYASALGNMTMEFLGCQPSDLTCAQNRTTNEVQAAQVKAMAHVTTGNATAWVPDATVYRPVVDGHLIPEDFAELVRSGKYNTKANILWGTTRDEGGSFVSSYYPSPIQPQDAESALHTMMRDGRTYGLLKSPYYKVNESDPDTIRSLYSNASTDFYFGCPLQVMSRGIIAHGINNTNSSNTANLYAYMMDHGRMWDLNANETTFCENRVCHAADLIPTFGSGDVLPGFGQTGNEARFSRQLIDRFTTFAKTGNPNPDPQQWQPGLAAQNPDVMDVHWPTYTMLNPLLHFKIQNSTVGQNLDTPRCNWIADNVPFEYQVHGPGGKFVPIYPPINDTTTTTHRH